jgi:outer membrane receptor protein involved in Fe transport
MLKKSILLVSCSLVLAQGAGAQALEEVVTTATRDAAKIDDVVGSISVVDEQSLKLVSHAHIQETLSRVAGVNLHRGNGQEYLPAVRSPVLTGAGGCGGFAMVEDGIPLRAAGFCNINELFEANTEIAERIEVLRGTGTVLYGSNAMHGVINVITPQISRQRTLGIEFGAHDYSRVKIKAGTDNFGIAANLTHDGGYRDDSGFGQQKLSLRHAATIGETTVETGLTVTNLNQETAGFIQGLDAYKDKSQVSDNLNPEAFRDVRSARLWSRISAAVDGGKLVITPYIRNTSMDFMQHFLPGGPLEENGQKSFGIQAAYYGSLGDHNQLIAGIDGEITDAYLRQSQDAPTQGSAFLQATIPAGQHYNYQVDAAVLAPFVRLEWSPNPRVQLNAGVRFESMHYGYQNNMLSGRTDEDGTECGFGGCRYSRPESGSNSFSNWSSNLGAAYQIDPDYRAYLRLARGFRAPQATELYRLQRAQQVTDLKSESIDSVELGISGRAEGLGYKVAVYHMEKDNVIFRDSDFFNISDGNTEHQGIELELDYQINDQFDLAVSATRARHRYLNSRVLNDVDIQGNDIDTAPRHFGSARIGWQLSEQSRAELEWQSMGSYQLDPENLHGYEGHDLVHLRANWTMKSGVRLFSAIQNLTDRRYAERADFSGFVGERYFPGMGRTMRVGAEFNW